MKLLLLCLWLALNGLHGVWSLPHELPRAALFLSSQNDVNATERLCADLMMTAPFYQPEVVNPMRLVSLQSASIANGTVPVALILLADQLVNVSQHDSLAFLILNADHVRGAADMPQISHLGPRITVLLVPPGEFQHLMKAAESGQARVRVIRDQILSTSPVYAHVVAFLVNLCAALSLVLGCWMAYLSRDKLMHELKARAALMNQSKLVVFLSIGAMVIFASLFLLLYYFFYDFAVYIAISVFCLMGVLMMAHVWAFWIALLCVPNGKKIPLNVRILRWNVASELSLLKLCMLPFSFAYMVVWLIYRNDPNIGWPMQCVAGIHIIAFLLSSSIPLPSLRLITICFSAFVFYDIFFVFISPYFLKHEPGPTTPAPEHPLARVARAAKQSFMEAVALGTAGQSGESIPVTFRLKLRETVGAHGCSYREDSMLLGFGDAVFPGFLCAFLIFYDSLWKVTGLRHFCAALLGYVVGIVITCVISAATASGQPALLYLCPCTLGFTVLTALLFGGKEELIKLWNGHLPMLLDSPNQMPTVMAGDDLDADKDDEVTVAAFGPEQRKPGIAVRDGSANELSREKTGGSNGTNSLSAV